MFIKLIAPERAWSTSISSADTFKIQKVNLPLLAALTPPGHTVRIVDEAFAPDCPDEAVDLVGITVVTDMAARAYQIARTYRRQGVPVVMGGIHPTVVPEEALQHADAVVVGEAENVWAQVISDAAHKRLRPVYHSKGPTDVSLLPTPSRELYPTSRVKSYTPLAVGVESSRGCPYDCEFCSVSRVMGKKLRLRPVREVIAEIECIPSLNLFFVDDSLGLNAAAAKELFREMIPLHRRWVGQGCVSLADNLELLRTMRRSGCEGLLVGFESVTPEVLGNLRKAQRGRLNYVEAVRRFHGEGIAILGAFVFGTDGEEPDVFRRTLDFILQARLDGLQARALVPYPGTRLYDRLLGEGRLLDRQWWLREYPPGTLLFHPKGMTPSQLIHGLNTLVEQFYSLGGITQRFFGIAPWKRTALGLGLFTGFNLANRKRYLRSLDTPQPLAETETYFSAR